MLASLDSSSRKKSHPYTEKGCVLCGQVEASLHLIKKGADVNEVNDYDWDPLALAVCRADCNNNAWAELFCCLLTVSGLKISDLAMRELKSVPDLHAECIYAVLGAVAGDATTRQLEVYEWICAAGPAGVDSVRVKELVQHSVQTLERRAAICAELGVSNDAPLEALTSLVGKQLAAAVVALHERPADTACDRFVPPKAHPAVADALLILREYDWIAAGKTEWSAAQQRALLELMAPIGDFFREMVCRASAQTEVLMTTYLEKRATHKRVQAGVLNPRLVHWCDWH